MIALVGPMTLAWSSLSSANDQRNEVTAAYLAQESIEYVKNTWSANAVRAARDITMSTTTRAQTWLQGLEDCQSAEGCDIRPNYITTVIIPCRETTCKDGFPIYRVLYPNRSAVYTSDAISNSPRENTNFKRKTVITTTKRNNGYAEEATVTTTVTWKNHAIPRTLTVSSVLYNY
jgi:hypothetical protein